MALAGVPVVPGYGGDRQEPYFLKQKAYEIATGADQSVAAAVGAACACFKALDFDNALAATKREADIGVRR